MITGIYEWFFCQKMAVSWRTTLFQKRPCWSPYFHSVFWVHAFWAKVSRKGNFENTPKKEKMTDNWKALVLVFLCFLLLLFSFFLIFFVFFVFCVFFGGFKGQVRWPEGPPHLALNPPYLHKKPCFPPRKRAFFLIFECLPLFLLSLFLASPPFSISLSLSLSCSCPFFFLLVFLFAIFWFLFLSLSFLFFLLCFCFMKGTTSKYSIAICFFINLFSFLGFLSCFFFQIPFSYLCYFLI